MARPDQSLVPRPTMTPAEEAAWAAAQQPEAWSSAQVAARRAFLRAVAVPQILDALVRKATRPGDADVAAARLVLEYAGVIGPHTRRSATAAARAPILVTIDGEELELKLPT